MRTPAGTSTAVSRARAAPVQSNPRGNVHQSRRVAPRSSRCKPSLRWRCWRPDVRGYRTYFGSYGLSACDPVRSARPARARGRCPRPWGSSTPSMVRACVQAGQLAVDTPVAPARVVACHLQHQCPYGLHRAGPSWSAARIHPAPSDQAGMPAQHRPRGHDQAQLAEVTAAQQPGQRGQDRPVGPRHFGRVHLALEHGDLVAQDEDLGVLGSVGAASRASQPNMRSATR
jgi:hypothetical protein